eukprot:CAMPEP_0196152876 /NCGR_PEP_ID=MMETSP0910-20130528/36260_1 /TAXON_ID=49265 /ORGANISM="Thalassiosira rotula, Strain GSO102" /LENGTH=253 /DNA_ID=CAMNT_0041416561 /DNA_START=78 /DNA_END=836 /DNA_ORIENTATION=-
MFPLKNAVSAMPRLALPLVRQNGASIPQRRRLTSQLSLSTRSSSSSSSPPQDENDDDHDQRSHYYIERQQPPSSSHLPTKNIRLEALKSVGITQLHNHTQDLISRTRQPLFEINNTDIHGNERQSIPQLQESARLESALIDALASYSSKYTTFSIRGHSIDVLGVEVSPDLKNARAYWCLPHSLDLDRLPQSKLEQVVKRMQQILEEKGGKIQALVHTRLRAYYPPKIKWVASEHVSKDLKRGVSLESGKKKW